MQLIFFMKSNVKIPHVTSISLPGAIKVLPFFLGHDMKKEVLHQTVISMRTATVSFISASSVPKSQHRKSSVLPYLCFLCIHSHVE